jgi:hypothetical protein
MTSAYARTTTELDAMRARLSKDIQSWDAIGDHRTGTEGDGLTAEWISSELRQIGLEPVSDWFDFQRRVLHECYVACGDERADGVPLFDGGFTDAAGLQAPLADLGRTSDIGLTLFGPGPWHPGTRELEQARRKDAHRAIVAVAAGDLVRPGLSLLNADDYMAPYGPPVLQVATEHLQWLEAARDAAEPVRLVAHVSLEHTQASNVQARISGADTSLPPLVIMTPRSAWWTCTSERAGGLTLWLECARHFGANRPDRTVIFTANTGHELGHVGLQRYLDSVPELVGHAHAWVHLGANFAAMGSDLRFQASTQELMSAGLAALTARGIEERVLTPLGERPLGEARNIYDGGGHYVSLLGNNGLFHHPDDRWPEAVDLDRTLALNQAMLEVVDRLARA